MYPRLSSGRQAPPAHPRVDIETRDAPPRFSLETMPAVPRAQHAFLILWSAATGLYVISVGQRVIQQGFLGLPATAGLSAMTGVWLLLLDLRSRTGRAKRWTARQAGALLLIGTSVVLNSILIVRALFTGESLPMVRVLSTAGLLYGLRIIWSTAPILHSVHSELPTHRSGLS
jgi:hypothetical protein